MVTKAEAIEHVEDLAAVCEQQATALASLREERDWFKQCNETAHSEMRRALGVPDAGPRRHDYYAAMIDGIMAESASLRERVRVLTESDKFLRELIEAYDAGQIEMNSPEIQPGDEPPHPWHEAWLYYARAALNDQSGKTP